MSKTLLEITEEILSDLSSDEISSIFDTAEATQVARTVISTYRDMMSDKEWPHLRRLATLTATAGGRPTHFDVPDDIKMLDYVSYNNQKLGETRMDYQPVTEISPDDFLRFTQRRNSDAARTDIVTDTGGSLLLIDNDADPLYYTSFNDKEIVLDAYRASSGITALDPTRFQIMAYYQPSEMVLDDASVPFLPDEAIAALITEAKSYCWINYKQTENPKIEAAARIQKRYLSQKAKKVGQGNRRTDFGRHGGRSANQEPTFRKSRN